MRREAIQLGARGSEIVRGTYSDAKLFNISVEVPVTTTDRRRATDGL